MTAVPVAIAATITVPLIMGFKQATAAAPSVAPTTVAEWDPKWADPE